MSTLDSWESVIAVIEQLQGLRGTSTANAATGTVCNSLTVQYLWRYQQPTPAPTSPNLAKKTWAALLKKKVSVIVEAPACMPMHVHLCQQHAVLDTAAKPVGSRRSTTLLHAVTETTCPSCALVCHAGAPAPGHCLLPGAG